MRSDDADAGADPRRGRARVRGRSAARWSGSRASSGRRGDPMNRDPPRRARSSAACSTRSPAEHQDAADLLDFCREENARIEAFCTEHDLIGIVDEPLDIRWTPTSTCAHSVGRCSSRRARSTGPDDLLRDHADPRRLDAGAARVVPARGQRPDAPPPHDPRGGPRPLPPGRVREPHRVAAAWRSSRAVSSTRDGRST